MLLTVHKGPTGVPGILRQYRQRGPLGSHHWYPLQSLHEMGVRTCPGKLKNPAIVKTDVPNETMEVRVRSMFGKWSQTLKRTFSTRIMQNPPSIPSL